MRLRFGIVLCLFAVFWGVGCRKPLTPNIDRNLAPETWITAAPMDTITIRDPQLRPIPRDPTVHVIPVRFHMYWAGSDPDGSVVGFYYAVTETTITPDPLTNQVPDLPGPKPQDYRYTTRTDTTFIFNVTPGAPDRQHAFFIYAVDNLGKADPTPARFMFTAIDKFPPVPIFDVAQAVGTVYRLEAGGLVGHPDAKDITDESIPRTAARDTVAANARLRFVWHARLGVAGSFVQKYCFKLEGTQFDCPSPLADSVNYPSGFVAGLKVFTLRAVDQAGGARDSTRRFVMNYMPDTWFAGPDPLDPQFVQTRDATGDRWYVDLAGVNMKTWPGISGTLMSPDSLKILPLHRTRRKTFFEIYNKRIYAHAENDTVHMNSYVLFYNGGYDKDSKYKVRVDFTDPALPPDTANYPVIQPRPENGSPIGFRSQVVLNQDPNGGQANFAQTGLYPIYEPASVFRATNIGGYWPVFLSGKGFAVARAQDGDGQTDDKVEDPRVWAQLVDGGGGSPEQQEQRAREVMTFYINKPPFLKTSDPGFHPKPDGSELYTGSVWSPIYLPADDVDPYDPNAFGRQPGVPTLSKVLRYRITVAGHDLSGLDTSFVYDPGGQYSPYYFTTTGTPPTPFIVPSYLADGPVKFKVQLCDCVDCEHVNGQGRCITQVFDATFRRTGPAVPEASRSPDRGGTR